MAAPISSDLRARVVAAWEAGEGTQRQIAERFRVGEASVRRWVARKRRTGSLEPSEPDRSGIFRWVDTEGEQLLTELVAKYPDATEEELTTHFRTATGLRPSRSTVHRGLKRLGYTRKKSRS